MLLVRQSTSLQDVKEGLTQFVRELILSDTAVQLHTKLKKKAFLHSVLTV